jgi:hypothetical protein
MTNTRFQELCGERLIDVDVALDNDIIRCALLERDDEAVIELLDSEF